MTYNLQEGAAGEEQRMLDRDQALLERHREPGHPEPVRDCPACRQAVVAADRDRRQSLVAGRLEVLSLPEWYQPRSNSGGSCPWCENMEHWGHAEGCARQTVLDILRAAIGDPLEGDPGGSA